MLDTSFVDKMPYDKLADSLRPKPSMAELERRMAEVYRKNMEYYVNLAERAAAAARAFKPY